MHVISRKQLKDFWQKHADFEEPARLWFTRMKACKAQNLVELRETFGTADSVGNLTVFNIGGNKYRLSVFIDYKFQKVFIRTVMTHPEYDTDKWKNDEWNQ